MSGTEFTCTVRQEYSPAGKRPSVVRFAGSSSSESFSSPPSPVARTAVIYGRLEGGDIRTLLAGLGLLGVAGVVQVRPAPRRPCSPSSLPAPPVRARRRCGPTDAACKRLGPEAGAKLTRPEAPLGQILGLGAWPAPSIPPPGSWPRLRNVASSSSSSVLWACSWPTYPLCRARHKGYYPESSFIRSGVEDPWCCPWYSGQAGGSRPG